jgi:hypothetical protein
MMFSNLNYKHVAGRAQEDSRHLIAAAGEHIESARVFLEPAADLLAADGHISLPLKLAVHFVALPDLLKRLSVAFSGRAQ